MKWLQSYYSLAAALVVSAGLQLSTIGRHSFWFDESYTSALLRVDPIELIRLTAIDVHPPLYYLLLKGWSTIAGTSDVALRIPSAFLMLASLVLLYKLVEKLLNRHYAGAAVLFAAVGPFMIRYGQEARMYGLGSVLILAASLVLVVQMQRSAKKQTNLLWVLYGVLIAATVYTHYFAGPIVAGHALYVLTTLKATSWRQRLIKVPKGWLGGLLVAGGLYAAWVPTLLSQFRAVNSGFWIPGVTETSFADTVSQLIAFYPLDRSSNLALIIAAFVGLALIVAASVWVWRKVDDSRAALVLLLGSVGILSLALFVLSAMPFTSSVYYLRYFAQYSALFYGGLGVLAVGLWRANVRLGAVVFAAAILLTQFSGVVRVLDGVDKSNNATDELYQQIVNNYQPGDALLTSRFGNYYDLLHYNQLDTQVQIVTPEEDYGSLEPIFRTEGAIVDPAQLDPASGRVWYLKEHWHSQDKLPSTWQPASQQYKAGDQALLLFEVN